MHQASIFNNLRCRREAARCPRH